VDAPGSCARGTLLSAPRGILLRHPDMFSSDGCPIAPTSFVA